MKYPATSGLIGGGIMKIFRTRKQLLVFFMPGFLLGIIYVNFIAKKYMAEPGIFSDYFLEQFRSASVEAREYIWYLLKIRAVPFLTLIGLSFTKARKVSSVLFLLWTGIAFGILISAAVLNMGIKGSLLCVAGLFPQFLFYIPAYLVLLWHCYMVPQNSWNRQKTIFTSLMMTVGIMMELYVNPILVKAFLSVM